jgi:hypothetical protein
MTTTWDTVLAGMLIAALGAGLYAVGVLTGAWLWYRRDNHLAPLPSRPTDAEVEAEREAVEAAAKMDPPPPTPQRKAWA